MLPTTTLRPGGKNAAPGAALATRGAGIRGIYVYTRGGGHPAPVLFLGKPTPFLSSRREAPGNSARLSLRSGFGVLLRAGGTL